MKLNEMMRYKPNVVKEVTTFYQNDVECYTTGDPIVLHDGVEVVKPIAWDFPYVFVVCPRCSQIEMFNIIRARKNGHLVYGGCKGRLLFCDEITDMLEQQEPFIIDESEH